MSHDQGRSFNDIQAPRFHQIVGGMTNEELLDFYLALPLKVRDDHFVDTASAAQFAGITQRTIQLWIESGDVRAVPIGKKYKVCLDSLRAYLKGQATRSAVGQD